MAGASSEREHPTDQRCDYCGRFFSAQGIGPHEEHCPVRELGISVDELDGRDDQGDTREPEPTGADVESQPIEADGGDPNGGDASEGGSAPRAPPSFDSASEPEPDRDDDRDGCPRCGSPNWFDPSKLPDDVLDHAPELAEFDRACMDCSTDDDGSLSATVEVYDT